jgi:hypothetical protein
MHSRKFADSKECITGILSLPSSVVGTPTQRRKKMLLEDKTP